MAGSSLVLDDRGDVPGVGTVQVESAVESRDFGHPFSMSDAEPLYFSSVETRPKIFCQYRDRTRTIAVNTITATTIPTTAPMRLTMVDLA